MSRARTGAGVSDADDGRTPEPAPELLKIEYADVMDAVYRSMRRYAQPGHQCGVAEVAALLGVKGQALRNQFGPTDYDHAPTLYRFLQVIDVMQPRDAVAAIADLADCVTLPRSAQATRRQVPHDLAGALEKLPPASDAAVADAVRRLRSGERLSADERAAVRDALLDVGALVSHLINRLRLP